VISLQTTRFGSVRLSNSERSRRRGRERKRSLARFKEFDTLNACPLIGSSGGNVINGQKTNDGESRPNEHFFFFFSVRSALLKSVPPINNRNDDQKPEMNHIRISQSVKKCAMESEAKRQNKRDLSLIEFERKRTFDGPNQLKASMKENANGVILR
jgi:hypothetical protein